MYEILLFSVALIGAAAGGWIDLKTTEVPDSVPLSMVSLGLIIHVFQAYFAGNLFPIYSAVAVAAGYLVFGYILYYTGQWGEADVLLLGAVGFVLPVAPAFFNATAASANWAIYPLIFLMNTFIVGGVYSIIYALVVAVRTKKVAARFFEDVRQSAKRTIQITLLFSVAATLSAGYVGQYFAKISASMLLVQLAIFVPAFAFLFLIYRFAVVVDREAFRKKISAGKLKEGDVLAEGVNAGGLNISGKIFIGLTPAEIKKIQNVKRSVMIKEGIRYGPTFFLALIATWLFGNLIMLAIG